jgi:hypothetical protein
VMVFSPETGYKFTVEVQRACTDANTEIWKLLFDLFKRSPSGSFDEIVSVEFVAGDPNDIANVAAITDEGMKRPQVRAFRDTVFPLVKPFAEANTQPGPADQAKIHDAVKNALNAV